MEDIKKIIRQVILQEFWGRKEKEVFSALNDLDKRGADFQEYKELLSQFPAAGEGASRLVYAIDDDLVVKLQKPGKDSQNEYEADPQLQTLFGDFVPRVFDTGSDYIWVVSERVTPVANREQEKEWLRKAGLGEIADRGLEMYDIASFLNDFHNVYSEIEEEMGPEALQKVNINKVFDSVRKSSIGLSDSRASAWDFTLEDLKRWAENPVIGLISRARKDLDVAVGDIGLGNIGFGSDGRPVILDIGLSQSHFDDSW